MKKLRDKRFLLSFFSTKRAIKWSHVSLNVYIYNWIQFNKVFQELLITFIIIITCVYFSSYDMPNHAGVIICVHMKRKVEN